MVKLSFLPAESVNSMQQEVTVQKILSMFTEDGSRTRGGLSPQSVPRTGPSHSIVSPVPCAGGKDETIMIFDGALMARMKEATGL